LTLPDVTATVITDSAGVLNIGSGQVYKDASGNVGIGTTSPTRQLEVSKAGAAYIRAADTANSVNIDMLAASSGGWIGTQSNHSLNFQTNNTERMRITSSGNVGIGTASPAYKLTVQSGSTTILAGADNGVETLTDATQKVMRFGVPHYTNAEEPVGALFGSNTSTVNNVFIGGGSGFFNAATLVAFYTAANTTTQTGSERMRIDSAGNVGIGVTPSAWHSDFKVNQIGSYGAVSASPTFVGLSTNAYATGSGGWSGPKYIGTGYAPIYLQSATSGTHAWFTAPSGTVGNAISFTQAMTLDSGGNLLVGTTSVDAAGSKIQKSSSQNRVLTIQNTANLNGDQALWVKLGSNCNTTASPHILCETGGTNRLIIWGNGNVVNTNNSYGAISDIKLKENIVDATPKLEKLNQVRIVNYNFIGEEQKQIGVIAQELEQLFPSMIDESPDRDAEGNLLETTTKSVKYSVFVPMLIKAIQEQQAIIEQLQADVATLKGAA
jgi:hypothetical protein